MQGINVLQRRPRRAAERLFHVDDGVREGHGEIGRQFVEVLLPAAKLHAVALGVAGAEAAAQRVGRGHAFQADEIGAGGAADRAHAPAPFQIAHLAHMRHVEQHRIASLEIQARERVEAFEEVRPRAHEGAAVAVVREEGLDRGVAVEPGRRETAHERAREGRLARTRRAADQDQRGRRENELRHRRYSGRIIVNTSSTRT